MPSSLFVSWSKAVNQAAAVQLQWPSESWSRLWPCKMATIHKCNRSPKCVVTSIRSKLLAMQIIHCQPSPQLMKMVTPAPVPPSVNRRIPLLAHVLHRISENRQTLLVLKQTLPRHLPAALAFSIAPRVPPNPPQIQLPQEAVFFVASSNHHSELTFIYSKPILILWL